MWIPKPQGVRSNWRWRKRPGQPGHACLYSIVLVCALVASALVVPAAAARTALAQEGAAGAAERTLYTCAMHPQVVRDQPGPCPICGMELTPLPAQRVRQAAETKSERKVKYWWDPMMNPPYISDRPGKSPMGMDLVPVYEDEVVSGEAISIDARTRQNMGVRTTAVLRGPLRKTVRAYAQVREPEGSRLDVALRVSGWIERLYADTEGMELTPGQPLFELFSPELQSAIEEWIALQPKAGIPPHASELLAATRRKLLQLGLETDQIDAFAKLPRSPHTVTFRSPGHLHVVERRVFEGAYVNAGETVLRLGSRQRLWVDARFYEQDLPYVREGQEAEVEFIALPGEVVRGRVSFLHPHFEGPSRTGIARIEVDNPQHRLREGMYATVRIVRELAPEATLVPREAIIDSGVRKVAFVDLGDGHFEPRQVEIGEAGEDGWVSVRRGLAPGERVVVSGQFLLDVESRLREAARKFLPAEGAGGGHGAHSH